MSRKGGHKGGSKARKTSTAKNPEESSEPTDGENTFPVSLIMLCVSLITLCFIIDYSLFHH